MKRLLTAILLGLTPAQAYEMNVVSSDATARFLPLSIDKAAVIDLPRDAAEVLVANPAIARHVQRTPRRVYIIGGSQGATNIHFFDAQGRKILALNVVVTINPQPEVEEAPAKVVTVVRGVGGHPHSYNCDRTTCIATEVGEAANTSHSVITVK